MIHLLVLGSVQLRKDGMDVSTVLAQPKRLALLAYLATARPRGFQSRDTLLALFWPESDSDRARNNLRQALHQLRRALGDDAIPSRGDREVGIDAAAIHCDAAAFDDAIERGAWGEALALYKGELLPGLFVQDAPAAERWMEDERARRRRDAIAAAWKLCEESDRGHDAVGAERWAWVATSIDPSDETAFRRLASLLDRSGNPAAAVAAYEDFSRRLKLDVGVAPSAETRQLVREIRERVARSQTGPTPAAIPVASPASSPVAPPVAGLPANLAASVVAPSAVPGAVASPAAPRALPLRRARLALAGAVLIGLGLGGWYLVPRLAHPTASEPSLSIAVLPFVNMSADPDNEFLSDGISEELLNLLAQVPGLRVAARTSSFTFKGRNVAVDSIGRVLRVRHVLEGSVRQAGPRLRITAQLIDAESGYHLWSGTFDSRVEDVVAVQDSIGRMIVDKLRTELAVGSGAPGESREGQRHETRDPDARIAVLKGWRAFRLNTRESYDSAAAHFGEAIRRDASYGRAYAGLATVRHWQAYFRYVPQDSGYAQAESLASRALALDSTLSEAHLVLGRLAESRWQDLAAAKKHYDRAIALNPSDARAYGRRASLLVRLGRPEEAIASAKRAIDLDPASPAVYSDLAQTYNALDRFEDEERALRSALSLDPGHPILLGNLAMTLVQLKKYAPAADAIAEARRRSPADAYLIGRQASIQGQLGRVGVARALLDTAEAAGISPVDLAITYAQLGDSDRAIALLERGVRMGDDRVSAILDPAVFPKLQGDLRMKRLIAQVRQAEDPAPGVRAGQGHSQ